MGAIHGCRPPACAFALPLSLFLSLGACASSATPKVHDVGWLNNKALHLALFPPMVTNADLTPAVFTIELDHEISGRGYENSSVVHPQPGRVTWTEGQALQLAREQNLEGVVLCQIAGPVAEPPPDKDKADAFSDDHGRRDYPFRDGTGEARGSALVATIRILRASDGATMYELTITASPNESASTLAGALLKPLHKVE